MDDRPDFVLNSGGLTKFNAGNIKFTVASSPIIPVMEICRVFLLFNGLKLYLHLPDIDNFILTRYKNLT
ncbi:hypothetical protein A5320_15870 [Rheinheimera sp. SA_1]|nr:hypothetical protein A5320_15870 [Rheinheimera sp. SA_1]